MREMEDHKKDIRMEITQVEYRKSIIYCIPVQIKILFSVGYNTNKLNYKSKNNETNVSSIAYERMCTGFIRSLLTHLVFYVSSPHSAESSS